MMRYCLYCGMEFEYGSAFPSAFGNQVILLGLNTVPTAGTKPVYEAGAANLTIQWMRIE